MAAADAEALFAEHHQALLRYLARAIGQRDAARDLAQEVYLRISRSTIPAASAPEVRAWLFRIARNLVIDHYRVRVRTPGPTSIAEPLRRPASQDVSAAVNEALSTLADLDRDVFLMREVSGLGYAEIAQACDLTAEAVRTRLYRTRLTLRQRLEAPVATHRSAPVLALALAAAYGFGRQVTTNDEAPPAPTRVVKAGEWQVSSTGGMQ